jgi:hypothetical protein
LAKEITCYALSTLNEFTNILHPKSKKTMATHFLPDAKTKVGCESLSLVASRKAKDGGDPEETPDE